MTLQTRFAVWMGAIFLAFIAIVSGVMYRTAQNTEEEHAYTVITELIAAIDATQAYVRHIARPKSFELLGDDEFVPELMSTSFVARKVVDRFLTAFPDYHFKFATAYPHNPANLADDSERAIIAIFQADPNLREWRGIIERNGREYLSVATPLFYTAECLQCHGDASAAPTSLQFGYPDSLGFGVPEGSVAIKSVGVPLSLTLAAGIRDALFGLLPIIALMVLVLLAALRLFRRFVTTPIMALEHGALAIERGNYAAEVAANGSNEFRELAKVFNGMSRSIRFEIKRREAAQNQIVKDYHTQRALAAVLETSIDSLPLETKLQRTLEVILSVPWFPAQPRGCIFLWDDQNHCLRMNAHQGIPTHLAERCAVVEPGKCICGATARSRALRFVSTHNGESEPSGPADPHGHYCVPILTGERLLGVFNVYTQAGHERREDEVEFLQSAASTLAGVIERNRAEDALRLSEERYALAAKGANDGLWDWDMKLRRIYLSPRCVEMLGMTPAPDNQYAPDEWLERIMPEDRDAVQAALAAHLEGRSDQFRCEFRMRHNDSSWRWVLCRGLVVRDGNSAPIRMVGSQTDITARKHAEERLEYNAFHDELTGLPNRARFMDRLQFLLDHSKRARGYRFAVLFFDIDRFKTINDSLGHLAGDLLLDAVAKRVSTILRPGDMLARLGGDEFVMLLDDVRATPDAIRVAKRIGVEVTKPFVIGDREVFTSASIGIAFNRDDYASPDELLRDADNAMYRAKADPDSNYQVFDIKMHKEAIERLQLETDLRRALERCEFVTFFQPVVSLADSRIVGFEALARWRHPQRGIIGPDQFIPLAEDTGLITAIGHWILEDACRHVQEWNETLCPGTPFYISVNISSRQLHGVDLMAEVDRVLRETRLPASCLRLEVTESLLMGHGEGVYRQLMKLKERGIGLYIDDFGTGYSSLSYMHRFPFDVLKIDRSFVSRIEQAGQANLVKTIIEMAESFGMNVIAEGVETEAQAAYLSGLSCNMVQGFLYSPPRAAQEIPAILAERRT